MEPPTHKLTVLLVEDEALIAEELRLTLEDFGYAVLPPCHTFAEGQRALAPQAHPRPDLVLLDLNLRSSNPLHNGLALAQQLRQQPAPTPFVSLTAYAAAAPSGRRRPCSPAATCSSRPTRRPCSRPFRWRWPAAPAPRPDEPPAAPADCFYLKVNSHLVSLYWHEVMSLEAGKNYVTLRAPARQLVHALRGSLASVLDQLVPPALRPQFVRVNQQHPAPYGPHHRPRRAVRVLRPPALRERPPGPPPAGRAVAGVGRARAASWWPVTHRSSTAFAAPYPRRLA